MNTERELILKAQEGNVQAFEDLVHRYDRWVLNTAFRFTSDRELAKDIYQETFLRAYRGLGSFKQESRFSTWLYRITANLCMSHRAGREGNEHSLEQLLEAEVATSAYDELADPANPARMAHNHELIESLQDAMGKLSSRQRLVFVLRHFEGLRLSEIAEVLECAEGTVKKHLFTATERLRARLSAFRG